MKLFERGDDDGVIGKTSVTEDNSIKERRERRRSLDIRKESCRKESGDLLINWYYNALFKEKDSFRQRWKG